MAAAEYSADQFTVLKGLEPVRLRPGMYTRTDSPTHILQEVIDNAADEALAGHATEISVIVHDDGSITVADNGRGIPVGIPPGESQPAAVLAFSTLHAGGKFDKSDKDSAYRFSGGLHGVGVAVTNALSLRLTVEIVTKDPEDNGFGRYTLSFVNGGELESPLTRLGPARSKDRGTSIRVWPDPRYFDQPKISIKELSRLLRSKAVLLPGITVHLTIPGSESQTWHYENGISDYLTDLLQTAEVSTEVFSGSNYVGPNGTDRGFAEGEGASWAMAWCTEGSPDPETYVNLIPTLAGGTHESGFRAGVFEAVQSFLNHHGLMPARIKLVQEDVTKSLAFVLSARILDPQFQGQTKEKLSSRESHKLLLHTIRDPLELWLHQHPEQGKLIAEQAVAAAQARTRAAQKIERRKSSGISTLPGKLTDCESTDLSRNELFLVEGDSAGGSAKMARDKDTQAILPLRGKVLNTWEVERDLIFRNQEVHDLAVAMGVDPHGPDPDTWPTALSVLRYGKIIVLSDADVDGSHIQVLLLTLFLQHFPGLLEQGHVFVAQPPLYRVDATVRGQVRKVYCAEESDRDTAIDRFRQDGVRPEKIAVQRFKGLGEMNPEQLWETAMCPDTRVLVPLTVQTSFLEETKKSFHRLMAKQESPWRRQWIEQEGWKAELDL